jgi:hypothetical protein
MLHELYIELVKDMKSFISAFLAGALTLSAFADLRGFRLVKSTDVNRLSLMPTEPCDDNETRPPFGALKTYAHRETCA